MSGGTRSSSGGPVIQPLDQMTGGAQGCVKEGALTGRTVHLVDHPRATRALRLPATPRGYFPWAGYDVFRHFP